MLRSVLLLLFLSSRLFSACSGSGLTWSCTAGSSVANVNSAIGSASDGATITFASGSYTWSSTIALDNAKGVTLICETNYACVVTVSSTVIGMLGTLSGTNTKNYRISGFEFTSCDVGSPCFWFYGAGTLTNLRIDHNKFTSPQSDATIMYFGEGDTDGYFYGVIDHNEITSSSQASILLFLSNHASNPASPSGTINNLFVEDNTITITTMTNAGLGCMDGWGGNAIVWRHNTTTNCLVTTHGTTSLAGGPLNIEIYENTFIVNSGSTSQGFDGCYRCWHSQGGGEQTVFNNLFTASGTKDAGAIEVTHYRSATPAAAGYSDPPGRCDGDNVLDGNSDATGYPCWRQPGRDWSANLKPMYTWNNRWSDTGVKIDLTIGNPWGATSPSVEDHIQDQRDYYNAVSKDAQTSASVPFNGTTGMGFGTLANRPTTCTTGALSGGGVGYFATDQGAQGTLYRCSATNTWTSHYTPYTYPHPLAADAGSGSPAKSPGGAKHGGGAKIGDE